MEIEQDREVGMIMQNRASQHTQLTYRDENFCCKLWVAILCIVGCLGESLGLLLDAKEHLCTQL